MTIKSIINNWYKELFWMGVGSVITLAAEKVVRTIKEKRQENETEEAIRKFAHDAEELWRKVKGNDELEVEEEAAVEPEESVEETAEDEPIVKVSGLDIISQEEFEDMQSGPDIYNRFELVYDPERCLFGYEDGFVENDLEDDLNIRHMFHSRGAIEHIIDTLCENRLKCNLYGSLSNGDVYICIHLGSVGEVK